ncbi:MAG: citramalate synthase [Candidatus Methanomethylophilaceae archaeon]|nr:citramalate synthase [Candidatus Methanomethylophilaceae archaeon]
MTEEAGRIQIYDTTLRDGAQTDGVLFSSEDKLDILRRLDSFGMDFVEGGWPGSNPRDDEFFTRAAELELAHTKLVAFGSTRRSANRPSDDPNLVALAGCPAEWCCIFGKAWDFQVTDALNIDLDRNLDMIEDSVRFLVESGKHVMFDAEHFFDGYRSNSRYAINALRAAESGGAEYLILCDTNGGSLPSEISEAVGEVLLSVGTPLGIHCHNDSGLATANTLAAVESGCTMVQGTVNGLGERCGNADLCSVIPNLVFKMGYDTDASLEDLTPLSRFVGEIANMPAPPGTPFVGERAFAHKGGIHVSALARDSRTYEHIEPGSVGNVRRILISEMAGNASVSEKLRELGMDIGDDSPDITNIIKRMEAEGYQFEGADASFELIVRRLRGEIEPMFEVPGFRIYIDQHSADGMDSEASVKVRDREGNVEHTAADGNGPVNALDNALRKALLRFYPKLGDIRLTDYKVRVLDGKSATASTVRVLIRSSDGVDSWTTVGVSDNVIEASLIALVDSIEYALIR